MIPFARLIPHTARLGLAVLVALGSAPGADAQFQQYAKRALPDVAFSVAGTGHTSYGGAVQLDFDAPSLNEGDGWGADEFTAPITGNYFFRFSFVRDSYYFGGTWDDVAVELRVGGTALATALAGESDAVDSSAKRMSGYCAVAVKLSQGQVLSAWATSDGNVPRHIPRFELTGFCLGYEPAFSVAGTGHTSYGNPDLVDFPTEVLDEGDFWVTNKYTIPKKGCYYFDLSLVRDSYYQNGTWDDVNLELRVNGNPIGYAWAGESDQFDSSAKRMTGAYSCALELLPGDYVQVFASSDGGAQRHVLKYELTGFRIRPVAGFGAVSAFSMGGTDHASSGSAAPMTFATPLLAKNAPAGATGFTAPVKGIYYFGTSFVRDSLSQGGTPDDVYLQLRVGGTPIGYAWAGESDWDEPDAKRMTGTYSQAVRLLAGQTVTLTADSDGGKPRHAAKYELTGFLLKFEP